MTERRSVAATAAAVTRRESSATAEARAALEKATADQLNTFTRLVPEEVMRRAAEVDELVAQGQSLPLAGVPYVVKDLINEAGLPNTCGGGFAPFVPAEDAACVAALNRAGAVAIGRVNLHEFAFGFSSENPWFGPVRNPLDPQLSTGGSSGGSAAAVAARIVPFALGTDTGGSVRVPAALCGIVGLKVTHGRGSIRGVYPLAPGLDTVGPLAATCSDAAAMYGVIAQHDPADPNSRDVPVEVPDAPLDIAGLRIAIPTPWIDTDYEAGVAEAFEAATEALADAGAIVAYVAMADVNPPGEGLASAYFEAAKVHRARFQADPAAYGADLQLRLEDAMAVSEEEYSSALRWRARVRREMEQAFSLFDLIATPTTAAVTKPIGVEELELGGKKKHYRSALSHFTSLVNNAGLPALSVPIARREGLPAGLQLIGGPWEESKLLAAGLALEHAGVALVPHTAG